MTLSQGGGRNKCQTGKSQKSYPGQVLVRVGADLEKLVVYAVGLEQQSILGADWASAEPVAVAEFKDPVLLTDNVRTAALPASVREALFALYQSYPRRVEHLGVGTDWSPHLYPRVWGASIDTVFFARTLRHFVGPQVHAAAEVGCGSGFLTKLMLRYGEGIEKLAATDINLEAVRCTADNLQSEPGHEKVHLIVPDAGAEDLALSGTYDLIASNPPYIPRPGARSDNPYEGLDLVARLAKRARQVLRPGGRILLNLSSLAGDEPLTWFEAEGLGVRALETMRVPLKVNPVTGGLSEASLAWRKHLEAQGRVEIDESEASGYRYWHNLRMFVVEAD